MNGLRIERVKGSQLVAAIDDLARLRIKVFREYPYLYDGNIEYEEKYLQTYCSSPEAIAVLARDIQKGKIVGASTGVPLEHETEEFFLPFVEHGIDPKEIFYCGESVLEKEYRGRGIYRHFFSEREKYGLELGLKYSCFCAVVRQEDHPLRPEGYQPLDDVWKHFGYRQFEGVTTTYPWKDIDRQEETDHPMQFWIKKLMA